MEEEAAAPASRAGAGAAGAGAATVRPLGDVPADEARRTPSGIAVLDTVLGGGFVAGAAVLLGGEPGIGKSTLLLQVAGRVADAGRKVLYVTGEESPGQVRLRAGRLGLARARVLLLPEIELGTILAALESERPELLVVDSIQSLRDPGLEAAAGTVTQVRDTAAALVRAAKAAGCALVLVGHVTREGTLAGPRTVEHLVDTVLQFEGERHGAWRLLRALKNRFGATDEVGVFEMREQGLAEVEDPSRLLRSGAGDGASGAAIAPVVEGSRALLVEVQALVGHQESPVPRRQFSGVDASRAQVILAVLEQRLQCVKARADVFLNAVGGLRVVEPAADLALALAAASAARGQALPRATVAVGEIGLLGEVREVGRLEARLREAARQGYRRALVPRSAGAGGAAPPLECVAVGSVREAIDRLE
jgi:DNA repair protein RadA/Sms